MSDLRQICVRLFYGTNMARIWHEYGTNNSCDTALIDFIKRIFLLEMERVETPNICLKGDD